METASHIPAEYSSVACGKSASDFQVSFNKSKNCFRDSQQQPVEIAFENLDYSVSLGFGKERKTILHGISGRFPPGQLIGILGPSGAGKTTLLEILSGFRTSKTKGTIYADNEVRNLREFKKIVTYLPQENHLQTHLTVWENMKIATDLKLGPNSSNEDKEIIIKQILNALHLDDLTHICAVYLSGGQQKRLSIALELINNPTIIFLDEPTTGLDSYSCGHCIRLFQELTRQGRTIICTIHQPSSLLFQLLDFIYVIAKGNCLYQGSPENLINFLEYVNAPCPMHYNPADYIIEIANEEYGKAKVEIMIQKFKNGKCFQWYRETKFMSILKKLKETQQEPTQNLIQIPSTGYQVKTLMKRNFLKYQRDATLTYMRLIASLLTGLLYGTLYWQSGNHGGKVRNNYGLLFCILIYHMMSTMMLSILTFPAETPILIKEHFNRWYTLRAYFISTSIMEVPILIFSCLLFTMIVYTMTGQPLELERIEMFTIISILVILNAHSTGVLIGTCFNVMNGTFVGFFASITIMLLAGFGESLKDLPVNLYWMGYLSYMKYGFEGIVGSIYGFDRSIIYCPDNEYCQYKYPKRLLKDVELQGELFWIDVLGLCVIFCILQITAYFVLKWKLNFSR